MVALFCFVLQTLMTGGRHGYGAKLANIFSNWFELETCDTRRGLFFRQRWERNMTVCREPEIRPVTAAERKGGDFTKVTFSPELARFQTSTAARSTAQACVSDAVQLMRRRVLDVAACVRGVRTTFNAQPLPVQCFEDYIRLFPFRNVVSSSPSVAALAGSGSGEEGEELLGMPSPLAAGVVEAPGNGTSPAFFCRVGDRWDVAVGVSGSGFEQLSFVNTVRDLLQSRYIPRSSFIIYCCWQVWTSR